MEFRYQIPEHLEGFIGNIPEPQLNALMTMLFEYAIQHRMIDYPRTEVENSIDEIRRTCNEIKSKQSMESSLILQMVASTNAQIATLHHMMSGGQMPSIPAMPMAYPTFYPPQMQYAAPTAEPEPEPEPDDVIQITEEELEKEGNQLGTSEDEVMSAFEDDMFK